MATPGVDRAVVDTDVLLAATDEAREDHAAAVAVLDLWPSSGVSLYTSGQILREYLAVATRPVDANGLGLERADAVANVRVLRGRMRLLSEDARVADRLLDVLEGTECSGKQVHDASVVAAMLVHGIDAVVTRNVGDFARFGEQVRVLELGR